MKIAKSVKEATMNKNKVGFDIFSLEDVRILPNQTAKVETGLVLESVELGENVTVELLEDFMLLRPFTLLKRVYTKLEEGQRFVLYIHNTGNRPAIVDKGEQIGVGIITSNVNTMYKPIVNNKPEK